jgi:hypothetical protein
MIKTKKVLVILAENDQSDHKVLKREKKYSSSRLEYLEEIRLQSILNNIKEILIFYSRPFLQIMLLLGVITNYLNHENPIFCECIKNISNTTS